MHRRAVGVERGLPLFVESEPGLYFLGLVFLSVFVRRPAGPGPRRSVHREAHRVEPA